MRKTEALRAAVTQALPELAQSPERLRMWIERGAGRSVQTKSLGFGMSYRLNLLVTEMSSDAAVLFFAIFQWMRRHQPDLMRPGNDGFAFDADFLDSGTVDLLVQLDLTENVAVTPQQGGAHALDYLAEPWPLLDDDWAPMPDGAVESPVPPLAGHNVDEALR